MIATKSAALVAAALTCMFAAGLLPARAQTFNVKQLEIKQGELQFGDSNTVHGELPPARASDVNRGAYEYSLDYGATDWLRRSGVGKTAQAKGEDLRFNALSVESLFVIRPTPIHGIGFGWFQSVDVATNRGATNATQFGPIIQLKADKVALTVNPFFETTFGANHIDGLALIYGWQAKLDVSEGIAIGVEGHGLVENIGHAPALSEQEHRIGPVVYLEGELWKDRPVSADIGLLFGLTDATPDVALKLNIGIVLQPEAAKSK
jgi:hypothetical protein